MHAGMLSKVDPIRGSCNGGEGSAFHGFCRAGHGYNGPIVVRIGMAIQNQGARNGLDGLEDLCDHIHPSPFGKVWNALNN
jgi:hypothetical protein